MKKTLLATTALVLTAGVASAEVTLSGWAEMGITDDWGNEVQFHQDVDVTFNMSLTTESGLTFGASVDLDEADGGLDEELSEDNYAVYMSGSFGNVTLGDTDGGYDWALTEIGMGSAIRDEHTSHSGYNGNSGYDGEEDGQVLRYDNTFGQVGVAVSFELDDSGSDNVLGLGVKYDAGAVQIGVGYQEYLGDAIVGISVSGEAGALKYVVNYSDDEYNGETYMGIGVGYTSGALMVAANYGQYDYDAGGSDDGYGLVANYDLGGGAVVMAGYGHDGDGDTGWSLGLGLAF